MQPDPKEDISSTLFPNLHFCTSYLPFFSYLNCAVKFLIYELGVLTPKLCRTSNPGVTANLTIKSARLFRDIS